MILQSWFLPSRDNEESDDKLVQDKGSTESLQIGFVTRGRIGPGHRVCGRLPHAYLSASATTDATHDTAILPEAAKHSKGSTA